MGNRPLIFELSPKRHKLEVVEQFFDFPIGMRPYHRLAGKKCIDKLKNYCVFDRNF